MADGDKRLTTKSVEASKIARENWARYSYGMQRGHAKYCEHAIRLERFYVGGGLQWDDDDRAELEGEGRKCIEFNELADAVNTALGNQIQNRVDIAYRPRGGGADDDTASKLSRVGMQVSDNNDYQHQETQVAADGFIQQRGYLELRVDYDENLNGEIRMADLDPLDVMPDPDAKSANPDDWNDVIITRWLSVDDIGAFYGDKARRKVQIMLDGMGDEDFGEGEIDGVRRNKFGDDNDMMAEWESEAGWRENCMVRVVDRQYWRVAPTDVALYPTGDIRVIEDVSEEKRQAAIKAGAMLFRRPMRRVRWTASTYGDVLLQDGWSPYKHFTVVPYFPFFRRGITRGLIDNGIGPQEMLNKALSQYLHIVNTTANSGWIVEQNSLTNMSTEDLAEAGSETGLILEYKAGTKAPVKIEPNQVPTGIDKLVSMGSAKIRTITGISDAMRGVAGPNQSGKAIQSLQFGSQLSMAVPLDNLARFRHLVASRILDLIQGFMDLPQFLRITQRDIMGKETTEELGINIAQDDGTILNDLTIGEYDAVVTEQPSQVTFETTQHELGMAMKKDGAPIPWSYLIRSSPLADKNELAKVVEAAEQSQTDPLTEAKIATETSKAALAQATSVNKLVEALFSAMRSAGLLRSDPAIAGIADMLFKSAGGVDADGGELIPQNVEQGGQPVPVNTNPITPDNPQQGVTTGIESGAEIPA